MQVLGVVKSLMIQSKYNRYLKLLMLMMSTHIGDHATYRDEIKKQQQKNTILILIR